MRVSPTERHAVIQPPSVAARCAAEADVTNAGQLPDTVPAVLRSRGERDVLGHWRGVAWCIAPLQQILFTITLA